MPGADALIPNSVLRVVGDVQGALCFLNLEYIDWLALQLIPDTAEAEWLDRWADIYLVNADGSTGRKMASLASGSITLTGTPGVVIPSGTQFTGGGGFDYQSTADVTLIGTALTAEVPAIALDPGVLGNLPAGSTLTPVTSQPALTGPAIVVSMDGGVDEETDDELRMRLLLRIRNPPMGGAANDYVLWALSCNGVTRAWCSPLEQGMGTVTVRFMMDNLRASTDPTVDGFPLPADVASVTAYLNTVRPVAIKDFYCDAPIPELINFTVHDLNGGTGDTDLQGAIVNSVTAMLKKKAAPAYAQDGIGQPAQTIYAAWVSDAISQTAGVKYFDLIMADHPMPNNGSMAVMGTVTWT